MHTHSSWPIENPMSCRGQSLDSHAQTHSLPWRRNWTAYSHLSWPHHCKYHLQGKHSHHDIDHPLQEHFTFPLDTHLDPLGAEWLSLERALCLCHATWNPFQHHDVVVGLLFFCTVWLLTPICPANHVGHLPTLIHPLSASVIVAPRWHKSMLMYYWCGF